MKVCFFTICTQSYTGMANALKQSIFDATSEVDFKVAYVDFDHSKDNPFSPDEILLAKDLTGESDSEWEARTFRYDVVELCTSVKPIISKKILQMGYEYVVFLDPDICFFGNPMTILSEMEDSDLMLTPHKLDIKDNDPLRGGIFNLGFIAMANTENVKTFLDWWSDKLEHLGSADPIRGYFTDQKWVDFAPVVLKDNTLKISRHPGMNVAPWNYDERAVQRKFGQLQVSTCHQQTEKTEPLIFCHFSGYDYASLSQQKPAGKSKNGSEAPPLINELILEYGKRLRESGSQKYWDIPYPYGSYSDGHHISYSDRRILKRLSAEGVVLCELFNADGEFRSLLENAGMLMTKTQTDPEKVTRLNGPETKRYEWIIDILFRLMTKILGYSRVSLLSRYLMKFCHIENRARWLGRSHRKTKVISF